MTVAVTPYQFDGLEFFADLGDVLTDALDNQVRLLADKPARWLASVVANLVESPIAVKLAETPQKAVVERLKRRVSELTALGDGPAADLATYVRTDLRAVVNQLTKMGSTAEAQQFVNFASSVAQRALAEAQDNARAQAAAQVTEAVPAASASPSTSPAGYRPPAGRTPGSPRTGFLGVLRDNWLPLAIVGAGGVLAISIALFDRKRPAMAGLRGAYYAPLTGGAPCPRLRQRWLAAEKRAHQVMLRGQRAAHRKAERASESAFKRGASAGCAWAV
jgi:hypothetical protein